VYAWAGQLRTIDISKGGNRFAHHGFIAGAAASIFAGLAVEKYLAGLAPDAFSDRAAHYLGELNALHPFREGNGRAQREFISHLAQANGYYIAWENPESGGHAGRRNRILHRRYGETRRADPESTHGSRPVKPNRGM
jgi:fido (protein-threonine AMPylation protein)